ncbi:hypothetical protein GXP71_12260 [Cellulomonas sp. H30R-01]|uniref:hypothetical protein n=1 Tax=Cellulomonas sp. H30R-01 TaxID=2704467 RepID=UPI00138DA527|nr:hypothetical protein [Cellulomonas sp. H30R-01]QHT56774.1 hypothetical protein GXP71_12260 [Cellulomonas sp. H30R-01]
MSTSDPNRPSVDETPDASATSPAPGSPAPTPSAATTPAGAPTTSTTPTTATTPTSGTTSEPSTDTGRHAVVRPAPTPPPEPDAARTETFTPASAAPASAAPTSPATAAPAPGPATTAQPATSTPPSAPRTDGDETLFPAPNAPRSTSFGAHVLGAILGLLLAPAGVGLVLVGQARILEAQVDGWDASTEVLGIVLVSIGLLLLGLVALLGIWSAAVPIAGGTLLTAVGGFYLFAPSVARAQTLAVLDDTGWRLTVTQVTVAGTSGTLLVAGFLVLLVGVVAAVARRRGVHLGEFRERHRV